MRMKLKSLGATGIQTALAAALMGLLIPSFAHADLDWKSVERLYDQKNMYGSGSGYYGWSACLNKSWDNQPIQIDASARLKPVCQPDTIYTWGYKHKLDVFLKDAPAGKPWLSDFEEAIFNHINPLATFGYGDLMIRIKLKPDTKFIYYEKDQIQNNALCRVLLTGAYAQKVGYSKDNTVIVRAWEHDGTSGVDYILCAPGPIHSWSFDMPKAYDELATSLLWNINRSDRSGWIPYVVVGGARSLFDSGLDNLDWSGTHLFNNMVTMREFVDAKKGQVIYNPSVTPDEAFHFGTSKPIYWNHQALPTPAPVVASQPAPAAPAPSASPTPVLNPVATHQTPVPAVGQDRLQQLKDAVEVSPHGGF